MHTLCIKGGRVIAPDEDKIADIGIQDGKIAEVGENLQASATVDATGMLVLPGMIDTHVHIRGGKFAYREDFASGTRAAAAGGVTTLLEMPVGDPPVSTPQAVSAQIRSVSREAIVNVALYGGAGGDNLKQVASLAKAGVIGYKTFIMPPPPGREAEFYGLCSGDLDTLCAVMAEVKKTGLPLAIHAEDNAIVTACTKKMMAEGGNDLESWSLSRPPEAELAAIRTVVSAAKKTGCRTSICHVSTPGGLDLIKEAANHGVDICAESCPSYLTMDRELVRLAGVFSRVKPPLRSPADRRELCNRLGRGELCNRLGRGEICHRSSRGEIAFVGSDHAPYTPEEKLSGDSIWNSPDGMPGLEMALLQMLSMVQQGFITYYQMAALTSHRAAEHFRLPGKGGIIAGKDADLVLVRPDVAPWSPEKSKLHTKARECGCCFELLSFRHRIDKTFVGGKLVYDNGVFFQHTGPDRFLCGADYYKKSEK